MLKIIKCFIVINLLWIVLLTAVPNIYHGIFQLNDLSIIQQNQLTNSSVFLVIAHPDDEVMFFAPTILELGQKKYNNNIQILCFSNGNADGLGSVRAQELVDSGTIFGIGKEQITIIEDESRFPDSMKEAWSSQSISEELAKHTSESRLVKIITFDEAGVSNHPNHKSLYFGAVKYLEENKLVGLFKLNSLQFWEKYSFTVVTIKLLVTKYICILKATFEGKLVVSNDNVIRIFSDLPRVLVSLAAMSYGHQSQMVWFRWGWLMCSRFVNYNELIVVR